MKSRFGWLNRGFLAVVLSFAAISAQAAVWKGESGADWMATSSWVDGQVPNGQDAVADFSAVSGELTVRLNAAVSVGKITLPMSGSRLTVRGAGDVRFMVSSGRADVFVGTGAKLAFDGVDVYGGGDCTKSGGGTLVVTAFAKSGTPWHVIGGRLEYGEARPLVHYAFDDPDNLGKDSGVLGKDLTADGSVTYGSAGKFSGCAKFDSGAFHSSDATGLPVGNKPFTILYWIRNHSSTYDFVTAWGKSSPTVLNRFGHTNWRTLYHTFYGGDATIDIPDELKNDAWNHYAVVFDGQNRKLYMNGAFVADWTGIDYANVAAGTDFCVGGGVNAEGKFASPSSFRAELDDVMIYGRALDAGQVRRCYEGKRSLATLSAATSVRTGIGSEFAVSGDSAESLASLSGNGDLVLDGATLNVSSAVVGGLRGSGTLVSEGAARLDRGSGLEGSVKITSGALNICGGGLAKTDARLVAYWQFDDPADPGKDSGPNGLALKAEGSTFAEMLRENGRAVHAPATTDYLTLDSEADYAKIPSGGSAFTVAAWIKPENASSYSRIISWGAANGQGDAFKATLLKFKGWPLKVEHSFNWGGDYTFIENGLSAFEFNSTTPPSAPRGWHHVAMTCSSASRRFFLDGKFVGESTDVTHNIVARSLKVGEFEGWIDEVMIFNAALSDAEVATLPAGLGDVGSVALEQAAGASVVIDSGAFGVSGGVPGTVTGAAGTLRLSGSVGLTDQTAVSVGTIEIAEGAALTFVGTPAASAPLVSAGAVALPETATLAIETSKASLEESFPILSSADALTGSTARWTGTVVVDGVAKPRWTIDFSQTAQALAAKINMPGLLLLFR